jgi:tetratricopeptide (TPR) repeat protein
MSAPTRNKTDPPRGWLAGLGPWWERSRAQMRRQPVMTCVLLLVVVAILSLPIGYLVLTVYHASVARDHLAATEKALELDDFETAIQELKQSLEADPQQAEAHFLLARTLRRADRYTEIDEHLFEAERLGWPRGQIELEDLLRAVQSRGPDPEEATRINEMIRARFPDEPYVLETMILSCARLSRITELRYFLTHWVTHYPDDWRARLKRGLYFYEEGNVNAARLEFETVLRLRPDHPNIKRFLGLAQLKGNHDLPQAAQYLDAHIKQHPNDVEAMDALARCQRLMGQPEACRDTLDRLFRRQRNYPGAYLTQAQVEADLNHPEFALEALQQFRQRPATSVEDAGTALKLAADLYRRLNRKGEAQAAAERSERFNKELQALTEALEEVRKGKRDPQLGRRIGEIYLGMGLEGEGRRWLQSVLHENPNDEATKRILEQYEGRKKPEGATSPPTPGSK